MIKLREGKDAALITGRFAAELAVPELTDTHTGLCIIKVDKGKVSRRSQSPKAWSSASASVVVIIRNFKYNQFRA